jgi:hypothetical protein
LLTLNFIWFRLFSLFLHFSFFSSFFFQDFEYISEEEDPFIFSAILQVKNESELKVANHLVKKNVPGNDEVPMELSNGEKNESELKLANHLVKKNVPGNDEVPMELSNGEKNESELKVANHLVNDEVPMELSYGAKNESELKVANHLVNDEEPMELSNIGAIIQVESISGMEAHSFKNLFDLALKNAVIFEQPSENIDGAVATVLAECIIPFPNVPVQTIPLQSMPDWDHS